MKSCKFSRNSGNKPAAIFQVNIVLKAALIDAGQVDVVNDGSGKEQQEHIVVSQRPPQLSLICNVSMKPE